MRNRVVFGIVLLAVFAAIGDVAEGAPSIKKERTKLPAFVKVCHRSDPQLNVCARNSLDSLKDRLKLGVPELFIPPIEPLIIPEMKLDQDSGAIYLHSTFRNMSLSGLSNYTLNEISIDPSKMKITLGLRFPNVTLRSSYVMNGKVMMMPLQGEGICTANFSDVELNTVICGQRLKKHGRTFFKVKSIRMKYGLGPAKMHLENLFNGDKALGERMNLFLNENWESINDEVRPLLENAMIEVVRSSTDKLFSTYSYDDLLPE